jgi:hypothetical protein
MLTQDELLKNKDNLTNYAQQIKSDDIRTLVDWLNEKDDNIRYAAFLLLQLLSEKDDRVYAYWETFVEKLQDQNSYQRSLGLMLIAENLRWDKEEKFEKVSNAYLEHCDDEKFVTARQSIQGLLKIIGHAGKSRGKIIGALTHIDLGKRKDTQRGLLLLDIAEVLGELYRTEKDEQIESYLKAQYDQGNDKAKKAIKKILG